MTNLDSLIATAHKLRNPGGCPWDAEQTHQSLVKYLIEEVYELVDAIESGNRDEVLEELGDVLYHVVFHSDLAEHGSLGEKFDIQDVAELSIKKMVGRHPHVFGNAEELEKYKADLKAQTDIKIAVIQAEIQAKQQAQEAKDSQEDKLMQMAMHMQKLEAMTKAKRILRDSQGRVDGVE